MSSCLFLLILGCGVPIAAGVGMWAYHRTIGYRKRLLFQAQVEIGNLDSYRKAFKDVYNLTVDSANKVINLNFIWVAMPVLSIGALGFVLIYKSAAEQYKFISLIVLAISTMVGSFQIAGIRERQKMAQKYIDMLADSENTRN